MPSNLYKKVLVILHDSVLPHMSEPTRMMDFLTAAYQVGEWRSARARWTRLTSLSTCTLKTRAGLIRTHTHHLLVKVLGAKTQLTRHHGNHCCACPRVLVLTLCVFEQGGPSACWP